MGELVPIVSVIFLTIVIVGTLLAKKNLSQRQVVKSLDEEEFIHNTKLILTNERALQLAVGLQAAVSESKATKKPTTVRYFIESDKMLELIVDCR